MKYIDLFNKYFLILMIAISFVAIKFDSREFQKQGRAKEYKQSKVLGYFILGISIMLFLIKTIL